MEKNGNKKMIPFALIFFVLLVIMGMFIFLNRKYIVTFDSDGGTVVENQKIKVNKPAKQPEIPLKEGYTFLGWYYTDNQNIEFNFQTKVRKKINLIAKWKKNSEQSSLNIKDENEIINNEDANLNETDNTENSIQGISSKKTKIDMNSKLENTINNFKDNKIENDDYNSTKNNNKNIIESTNNNSYNNDQNNNYDDKNNNNSKNNYNNNSSNSINIYENNNNNKNENINEQQEISYYYKWGETEETGSIAGQYKLYIVSSEDKNVAGTATITTISGTSETISISEKGNTYLKDAIASVSDVKAN